MGNYGMNCEPMGKDALQEQIDELQQENEILKAENKVFVKKLTHQLSENQRLRDALEEIRDLARTGVAPMSYNMTLDQWRTYKLNKIAGMVDKLLKEGE